MAPLVARWLAGIAVVVAASCDGAGPGAATPATGRPSPPVEIVETRVVADFGVAPAAPHTALSTVRTRMVDAGRGSVAIFAVERPAGPPRCIAEARLRLFLERSSGPVAEELAVYPSHVFDAAAKRDGERFGYSGALLDVRPRATFEDGGSGWSEWDVTPIVKRWIGGGAFPSVGHRAPERGPVVLALRDVDGAAPFATATVASADAPTNPPQLVVAAPEGCA